MEKELLGFQTITKKVAQNIHEYLYSSIKLGDQEKATLIAGILIALENESFKNTYRGMTDEDQFVDSFMSAVRYSILKYDGLKNGKEEVISVFDYIKHNSNFKSTVEQNGQRYIALQFLTEIIHKSVYNIAKTHPTYDILGEFYNEFTRYSGADQQSLGIVLTPHHIAEFMSELLEINDEDVILDTCIGSASLALTAENSNIKENKVVGVEFNARMLSLAVANTMIRNIPSYLMLGDSWNPEIIEKINTQKPTKLIINPPYAQDGYPELGFVRRGLDSLQPGGLGVVIVPMSSAIKSDNKTKKLKKELLEKHSLVATFSMPDQLFYPVGVVTIVMLFKAHEANNKETFFGNLKNDGFEITRVNGRVDTKNLWTDIKQKMLDLYKNMKSENGKSAVELVSSEMEWAGEAYIKNDLSVNKEDFIKALKEFSIFILNEKEV